MDFKKIADHFRARTAPLAVSQIVIVTGEGDFTGNGKLRRNGDSLELEVTLVGERELPTVGGIFKRDQFWKIGGLIEDQFPFWAVSLPHQHTINEARFVVRGGLFHFDRVHHLTLPFEAKQLREAVIQAASSGKETSATSVRGYVDARLTDYKLVWLAEATVTVENNPFLGESIHTERNTLRGRVGDFEYGLIQRGDDCDIHLRLKDGADAQAGAIDRLSQALYRALAFVHGRHTWPQWEQIDSGTGNRLEYATAPRKVSANFYTPLTGTTSSNGSDPTVLIGKAVECFLREDAFSKEFDNYLFLTREAAADETPIQVGTLGLCAVLEGFVSFLHQHFCGEKTSSGNAEFEQAKSTLIEFVKERANGVEQPPNMADSWKRFIGLLQSARPLRPADKYCQLVEHFRLPPGKMSAALEAWKVHRHPLAHGASAKDDRMDQLVATSRIAGAINVLAAAALGFSGLMVLSRIEDKIEDEYIRLP
ncbi:MAG TPA: hypothetical protein VIT91_16795 [Chthoniobacterales bacterium]